MLNLKPLALAAAVVAATATAAFAAIAWHPAIAPLTPDKAAPPADAALVTRGAELAALGDCQVCHTAPGGKPYAGGYRLNTPFGAIYTSNLTPDPQTGIGRWPLAAFDRAMRQGVDRAGNNLYPALPYDHFTRVSDADLAALYAFLQAGDPVQADRPPNQLAFPFSFRPLLAGWNLLFLRDHRFQPDPAHDAAWNRGAYLVEGLGHCGGCHTTRNALGAEETGQALRGGKAEGWSAWPIVGSGWSEASFYAYLRDGVDAHHGAAAGPMAPVSWNLHQAPDADVHAIAAYLASLAGPAQPEPREAPDAAAATPGAAIFAGACNSCHGPASPMHAAGAPYLNTSSAIRSDDPGNALRVILGGIPANPTHAGPQMPAYGAILSSSQIADVAAYVRARYAPGQPAWTGLAQAVDQIRTSGDKP